VNERNPAKLTSPATERRFVADVRQFWDDSANRHDFQNPWPKVKLRTKGKGGQRSATTGAQPVDPELVLSPIGVWWLAAACAHIGSWGPSVAGYVLLMGICGLRPSEAAGVRIEDLELPASGPGWVTVRRSKREVAEHWLDPDEDPLWGPLKDRDLTESRRAPIPGALISYLNDVHIPKYCYGRRRGLLFEHNGKPYDLSAFADDVWNPSRALVLPRDPDLLPDDPRQPRLSRLRRHDLRHAACSMWLNTPNVDVKIAQRWSGHRTLSVFLDIYQGIMPRRELEAASAVHALMG
jgi:integrase